MTHNTTNHANYVWNDFTYAFPIAPPNGLHFSGDVSRKEARVVLFYIYILCWPIIREGWGPLGNRAEFDLSEDAGRTVS